MSDEKRTRIAAVKSCDELRLMCGVFGHQRPHRSFTFTTNRNPVECRGCGEIMPPGAAMRQWCKRHKHTVWVGIGPDSAESSAP